LHKHRLLAEEGQSQLEEIVAGKGQQERRREELERLL
jgi:hypothetical protein